MFPWQTKSIFFFLSMLQRYVFSLTLPRTCSNADSATSTPTTMNTTSPEFDRLAFTVLAIEASAQKMGISPSEMRRRLDKVGLIKSLIQDCYETLHTESREAVANDVVEALKNWERE